MKWFKRLLQIILSTAISIFIASYALQQLAGSGLAINSLVKDTGAYYLAAGEIRQSLKVSTKIPVAYQAQFETAVDKSLTAEQVEAIIKPTLVDVASWLQQPANVPLPDFVLLIKPAKTRLLAEMQSTGLKPIELQALESQLTQQIPDQIKLSKVNELTGQSSNPDGQGSFIPKGFDTNPVTNGSAGNTTPTASTKPALGISSSTAPVKPAPTLEDNLKMAKQYLGWVTLANPISLVLIIICLVSLLWFGRRDERKWLRRPAWSFISPSLIYVVGYFIVPQLIKIPAEPITRENFAAHLVPLIINRFVAAAFMPAVVASIIGLVLLLMSFFIRKKMGPSSMINQLPNQSFMR